MQVDQESVARNVAMYQQTGATGNSWHFQPKISELKQRFLLVHQTARQKELMKLYGNVIVGMDATYKTSQWGFPLFLLNVVTNHGRGHPVAMFMVEEESSEMVGKALEM